MPERRPLSDADIIALGEFSGNQVNARGDDLNVLFDPETQDEMRGDARIALLGFGVEVQEVQRVVPKGVDDSI